MYVCIWIENREYTQETVYTEVNDKLLFPHLSALACIKYSVKAYFKKSIKVLRDMLLVIFRALCYGYTLKLSIISPQKVEKCIKNFPTLLQKKKVQVWLIV